MTDVVREGSTASHELECPLNVVRRKSAQWSNSEFWFWTIVPEGHRLWSKRRISLTKHKSVYKENSNSSKRKSFIRFCAEVEGSRLVFRLHKVFAIVH